MIHTVAAQSTAFTNKILNRVFSACLCLAPVLPIAVKCVDILSRVYTEHMRAAGKQCSSQSLQ